MARNPAEDKIGRAILILIASSICGVLAAIFIAATIAKAWGWL